MEILRRKIANWNVVGRSPSKGLTKIYLILLCLAGMYSSTAIMADAVKPVDSAPMWDSALATDAIVLPGFSRLQTNGTTVLLGGGRKYEWNASFLPGRIEAAGAEVAGPLNLVLRVQGREITVVPSSVRITESKPDHVTITADGEVIPNLLLSVVTRVEYDGVAMVAVKLTPRGSVEVEGFDFRATIRNSPSIRMLIFDADNVRKTQKKIVFAPEYDGAFLNVIAFPDGDRSFWWFADNAEGWIWNGNSVTEVTSSDKSIDLRQRLIGGDWTVKSPLSFRFNLLTTPIRDPQPSLHAIRVAHRPVREEGGAGQFQLWWTNVFAHEALPYVEYPPGARERLPAEDIKAYAGPKAIREQMRLYKSWNLRRLPYFSAHVLSVLDPALQTYRASWEVDPSFVIPPGSDGPYTAKLERPWLSHRAPGYTDYLISRFNVLIDQLDMDGMYLDQGNVIQSKNPANGAWRDSNGVLRASTDILALRSFFKRLATLFYLKGRPGYIIVHNSMSPIVPAYTFVTAMLQGEEYRDRLRGRDYIASSSLDTIRSSYSPDQYGVGNIWLSELWAPEIKDANMSNEAWIKSPEYEKAFRNFLSLALLHDIPVWDFAPLKMRRAIYAPIDDFGAANAEFVGYWQRAVVVKATEHAEVSFYRRNDNNSALMIVANLGNSASDVEVSGLTQGLKAPLECLLRFREVPGGFIHDAINNSLVVSVPSKDFRLLTVFGGDTARCN